MVDTWLKICGSAVALVLILCLTGVAYPFVKETAFMVGVCLFVLCTLMVCAIANKLNIIVRN